MTVTVTRDSDRDSDGTVTTAGPTGRARTEAARGHWRPAGGRASDSAWQAPTRTQSGLGLPSSQARACGSAGPGVWRRWHHQVNTFDLNKLAGRWVQV